LKQKFDDKAYWAGIVNGSRECFNLVFQSYYSELYYWGLKIIPDSDIVKESIQELFVRVWERRGRLSDVNNPKSYLMISLRREILAAKKARSFVVTTNKPEDEGFFFDLNEFEKNDKIPPALREFLLQTINSLPKQQREMIHLYFYHELSYTQISEVMEISVPSARNLMYRTILNLRKQIGDRDLDKAGRLYFDFLCVFIKKVREK